MIQRIQTLFLLLSIVALGFFLWMPLIGLEASNFSDALRGYEVTYFYKGYIIFANVILAGVAAAWALIAIFLFRKRNLQILFCWFALVFILGAELMVYYRYQTQVFSGYVVFTWWNLLALVAALLLLLSIVYIRKDEKLIKSLDRLR